MTVAELLAAVAVIGVGLVALGMTIPLAGYGIQEGNQLSTATFLASQRLEQVRNARWEAPNCGLGTATVDELGVSPSPTEAPASGGTTTFPEETPVAAPYADYTRTVRIVDLETATDCDAVERADLRQVTVTVAYRPLTGMGQAPAGTTKSAVLTMYIAKR
jgi:hypothetical protein